MVERSDSAEKEVTKDSQSVASAKATAKQTEKTIEVKLSLPSLPNDVIIRALHRSKRIFLRAPRKARVIGGGLGLLALGGISSHAWLTHHQAAPLNVVADVAKQTPRPTTPDYPTKLPAGKTIQALGGWRPSSPAGHTPAFAYADKIGKNSIIVSQQQLPDDFKKDTAQKVNHIAAGFNATQKAAVGSNIAYISNSAQGPQSVIFSMDNLLIILISRAHIDTAEWVSYISSLK